VKLAAFKAVAGALARANTDYLVVGGVAVNVHGYLRFTRDIDIVASLYPDNVRSAFTALATVDYYPALPFSAEQFSDERVRKHWLDEKAGAPVLEFISQWHAGTSVNIFMREPFDVAVEQRRAMTAELAPDLSVQFVSIHTLIAMKERAGRPRDRDDVQHLRWMLEDDMIGSERDADWSAGTWEGSRREQIRRWRKLTVRRKLQGLDEMTELAEELYRTPRSSKS